MVGISVALFALLFSSQQLVAFRKVFLSRSISNSMVRTSMSIDRSIATDVTAIASLGKQVLQYTEPSTGVQVVLIGAMHYNPASIMLTETIVSRLGSENRLASVIIESCSIRFNKTKEMNQLYPLFARILRNEMQTARDVASRFRGVPLVLGDQLINITSDRIKQTFQATLVDLVSPFQGGWVRLYSDITSAFDQSIRPPSTYNPLRATAGLLPVTTGVATEKMVDRGAEYLGADAFFDPALIAFAPVSLIRYPLALAARSPAAFLVSLLVLGSAYSSVLFPDLFLSSGAADGATAPSIATAVAASVSPLALLGDNLGLGVQDIAYSALTVLLEVAVLGRVFLVPILAERNEVLAESILAECKREKLRQSQEKDLSGRAVVAVLGMAHCNGIKRIMTDNMG